MTSVDIRLVIGLLVGGMGIVACAGKTPGAEPHAMNAAAHEDEARKHEITAAEHARSHPAIERLSCSPGTVRRGPNAALSITEDICWTSVENPTTQHLEEAELHRGSRPRHFTGIRT